MRPEPDVCSAPPTIFAPRRSTAPALAAITPPLVSSTVQPKIVRPPPPPLSIRPALTIVAAPVARVSGVAALASITPAVPTRRVAVIRPAPTILLSTSVSVAAGATLTIEVAAAGPEVDHAPAGQRQAAGADEERHRSGRVGQGDGSRVVDGAAEQQIMRAGDPLQDAGVLCNLAKGDRQNSRSPGRSNRWPPVGRRWPGPAADPASP